MDADRSGDQMTESAVDRELQAMLAVEPSPEFVARVRTRVASEPEPTAWWLSWKLAVGVAMAVVVVLAVVMARPRSIDPMRTLTAIVLPNATTTMAALKGQPYSPMNGGRPFQAMNAGRPFQAMNAGRPFQPVNAGRPFQPVNVGRPFQGRLLEPEVLLDPRESAALRALIRGAHEGRVDLAPALRASMPSAMDLPPIGAIDIPFLTIDPITPGSGDEGVRQ
jgi:hypothetical protein